MRFLDIFRASKIKAENEQLHQQIKEMQDKMDSLGITEYIQASEKIRSEKEELDHYVEQKDKEIADDNTTISKLQEEITSVSEKLEKLTKQAKTIERKLARSKELYLSVDHAIQNFFESDVPYSGCKLSQRDFDDYELISPSVTLKLHCMDVKDLRKAYRENEKQIDKLLSQYSSRYTTKANKSIYSLMVIALRAELQNILYNLKYEKLEKSIEDVKNVSAKYLKIAGEGNQSIAGTLTKFIGEIEYLFINAVKIEYNYYVKKEQSRQEQLAIREQMRQEALERKALEAEKKKVEKEESKYITEIEKLKNQLESANTACKWL